MNLCVCDMCVCVCVCVCVRAHMCIYVCVCVNELGWVGGGGGNCHVCKQAGQERKNSDDLNTNL